MRYVTLMWVYFRGDTDIKVAQNHHYQLLGVFYETV